MRMACGWIRMVGRCRRHLATPSNSMCCTNISPTDAIRYFCLREMVFGADGRFGYESLIDRTNSDLASGLGNLSSRTLTMIQRYCEGRIPSGAISDESRLAAKRAGVEDESAIS